MTGDRAGLSFREDYFDDPGGWAAVMRCFWTCSASISTRSDRLGGPDRTLMSLGLVRRQAGGAWRTWRPFRCRW